MGINSDPRYTEMKIVGSLRPFFLMNQPANERQQAADAFAKSLADFQELLAEVAPDAANLPTETSDDPLVEPEDSSD